MNITGQFCPVFLFIITDLEFIWLILYRLSTFKLHNKMMKQFILILFIVSLFSCRQTPMYNLNVRLDGAEGKAYLSQRIKGEWVKLDSAEMINGEYSFKGSVKNPDLYYFGLGNNSDRLVLFIENSNISIVGRADSLLSAKVSGSSVQDEYMALQSKLNDLDGKGTELYKQSKEKAKEGLKVLADSLMALSDQVFLGIENQQKDYIKANPASWISPFLLGQVYYEMDADVLGGFLSGLDSRLDSTNAVLALKDRVDKLKLVAIGQPAPDFIMNDQDGNPVKLSDICSKNSFTLIDFWASWCGPCRRENPNVVLVYNKYKSKGFGVLGVSLDNDKEKWVKTIADDKLTWNHVSDLKKWKNEAAILYSVNSIPSNFLVDQAGKIVGRNLRELKLGETIDALLK